MTYQQNKEILDDYHLKQHITKDYDNCPEPPVSKDKTWEMIRKEIQKDAKPKKKLLPTRLMSIAAVAVITIIGGLFLQVNDSQAFGWITKYFITSNDEITQIGSSIKEPGDSGGLPSPDQLEEIAVVTKTDDMELAHAQQETNFHILVPKDVPDGYTLGFVTVYYENDMPSTKVILNYRNNEKTFTIEQIYVEHEVASSMVVDNDDTKVQNVELFTGQGTFISFKDNTTMLMWSQMNSQLTLDSSLSLEKAKMIANSME
ncbi:DUF4367 domain-containing protein [Aquibacillus kalidii]|uniref:DUF4367 domain-containing protein n=1 Tax=Aquibacillus kalidii TaxID=2762597 RepID=UPI001645F180|nr:DUF4367 domain-containing protein [Aquibacillus kalidii]